MLPNDNSPKVNNNNSTKKQNETKKQSLLDKISDINYPLEEFLNDEEVIPTVKSLNSNINKYLNSEKIKQLIKYIIKEPEENNLEKGYKYAYISCEIFKTGKYWIYQRFTLSKEEYFNKFKIYYKDIKDESLQNTNQDNKERNIYLDLLLDFVLQKKIELNYILCGYFLEVILELIKCYPSEIIKYIYSQRKEVIKIILFRSYQKPFSDLAKELIPLEKQFEYSFIWGKKERTDFFAQNLTFRKNILKEILISINLDGYKINETILKDIDISGIFVTISEIIKEDINFGIGLMNDNQFSKHLFDILSTNLYSESEQKNNNFENHYIVYNLFINLATQLLKILHKNCFKYCPSKEDYDNIKKIRHLNSYNINNLYFQLYMILAFENILKYNFIPKKPTLIIGKLSDNYCYEGLGILILNIIDLTKTMFFVMSKINPEYEKILFRKNFCEKSLEYFFKYQWNNIYQTKFLEFFNHYLLNEKSFTKLTKFYFHKIKLQNILSDFLENKITEDYKYKNIIPKIRIELKSGNKIRNGIYSHVILLVYKIQTYSGLKTFSPEEIKNIGIRNFGEFKFTKNFNISSFAGRNKIIISENLKYILIKDTRWNSVFRNIAFPVIKKYEKQLFKSEFNKIMNEKYNKKLNNSTNNNTSNNLTNQVKNNDSIKEINIIKNEKENNNTFDNNGDNKVNKIINDNKIISDDNNNINKKDEIIEKTENNNNKSSEECINEKKKSISKYSDKDNNINLNIVNDDDINIDKSYYDSNYWKINNNISKTNKKENEINEEDELLNIATNLELVKNGKKINEKNIMI